ncbi:MAG: response regulator [Gemmatimonadetes bacterium]|nr:response regulator [Gemmatimonadota bacterium]
MKILVAEDDLVTREILKRILTHMSDEILEANNGVEALEMIERHDPDFLFTDIQMPLLDGLAVVEAVRSSRTHSMLPIVCMASVKDNDDITRLVSLGIADYILKPLRLGRCTSAFAASSRSTPAGASDRGPRGRHRSSWSIRIPTSGSLPSRCSRATSSSRRPSPGRTRCASSRSRSSSRRRSSWPKGSRWSPRRRW